MRTTAPSREPGLPDQLHELIARRRPGFTLETDFYCAPDVFALDVELLARRWMLVDHVSRIPEPGDWFVVEIGPDSYIVTRGRDREVRAFHNVCRHRGSRICLEESGNDRLFVCPYHSWSYRLDGSLHSAREMGADFDPEAFGLLEIGARVLEGLVFISPEGASTEGASADFDREYEPFIDTLKFHGMSRTKVAERRSYPTAANWKLVVENFLECYHCLGAHKEYSAVHSRAKLEAFGAGPGSGDPDAVARFEPTLNAWHERATSLGHPTPFHTSSDDSRHMSQVSRTPIGNGDHGSETRDGSLGCRRLLGSFKESDGGQTAFGFSPTGVVLANCDFAFMITFRPVSPLVTIAEAVWLVDEDAVEGRDYDREELAWLWDTTLAQDKTITENNQRGVSSRGYTPGPYAMSETRTETFTTWYLNGLTSLADA